MALLHQAVAGHAADAMGRVDSVELVGTALLRYAVVSVGGLVVAVLVKHQDTIRVNCVGSSSGKPGSRALSGACSNGLAFRIRLGNCVKTGFFLVRAATASAMVAAASFLVSINRWLKVSAFTRLLTAVALDVGGARFAHGTTVSALRDWATLFVDMLKWSIRVLTVAHTMTANASLAGPFLSVNNHFEILSVLV